MLALERRNLILEKLQAEKRVVVSELSQLYDVSEETIRRDLEAAAETGNKRAQLALDVFDYRVIKYIGAYAAAMNGVDAIAFTAGIGENNIKMRKDVCSSLTYLGVKLDEEKNNVRGEERIISADDSKVQVLLVPTNEELAIARETLALVK